MIQEKVHERKRDKRPFYRRTEDEIDGYQQEQMNLRFQMVTGQLTDHSRFKVTRRLIARIETILAEREREAKEK